MAVIRGSAAAASLKLIRDTGIDSLECLVIRGSAAAASLKQIDRVRVAIHQIDWRVIRGSAAAASLKHGIACPIDPHPHGHPRQRCRGFIEAATGTQRGH